MSDQKTKRLYLPRDIRRGFPGSGMELGLQNRIGTQQTEGGMLKTCGHSGSQEDKSPCELFCLFTNLQKKYQRSEHRHSVSLAALSYASFSSYFLLRGSCIINTQHLLKECLGEEMNEQIFAPVAPVLLFSSREEGHAIVWKAIALVNVGECLKPVCFSSVIGEHVILIETEVTGAPQNSQRPVKFFLLCGYGFYTASTVCHCSNESQNPQLVIFSLNILISLQIKQIFLVTFVPA